MLGLRITSVGGEGLLWFRVRKYVGACFQKVTPGGWMLLSSGRGQAFSSIGWTILGDLLALPAHSF